MEEMTDLDMEVARQLVQLSEGDTTTTTTATTSSSDSCNSIFHTLDRLKNKRTKIDDVNIIKQANNNETNSSFLGHVAGELDVDEVDYQRKKSRRYRSIVELYNITKPLYE